MHALTAAHFHDEDKARQHLEAIRWPNGPVCPHCGVTEGTYRLNGKAHRPGLLKCGSCREQFSVTVGTVFERSKIPLTKWLMATQMLTSGKKGCSSHQIHRTLGVTYKTAWFMTHRIREGMRDTTKDMLGGAGSSGIVEADETYYGKTKGQSKVERYKQKQQIVALVERKGRVRAFHVATVNKDSLKTILHGQIAKDARLMTDGAGMYKKIGKHFASHETVDHAAGEYARGDVTTNSVEGFFGTLKMGIGGVYQRVSPAHLSRYVDEFAFRYNNRIALDIDDTQRAVNALAGIGGKRLVYRQAGEESAALIG